MPEIHVRDPDDSVHSRVIAYARRSGQTVSEAVRELLARGLETTAGEVIDAAALAQQLHARIAALDGRIPASIDYHRVALVTNLECVMLLRQLVNATKPELLPKAKKNTKDAYDQLIQERKV